MARQTAPSRALATLAASPLWAGMGRDRPILVVVKKPGAEVSDEDIRAFLGDKIAKWWMPDAIEFVDDIPHTGTGKISKKDLRERFKDYKLEGAA